MAHVELKEGWDSAVAKAGEDLKKRMDDFMQGLKEALLTEEMQEAVDNIAVLIGGFRFGRFLPKYTKMVLNFEY